jgi:hypothetical protein
MPDSVKIDGCIDKFLMLDTMPTRTRRGLGISMDISVFAPEVPPGLMKFTVLSPAGQSTPRHTAPNLSIFRHSPSPPLRLGPWSFEFRLGSSSRDYNAFSPFAIRPLPLKPA